MERVLPGEVAFKLYDTYGLAIDEQEEMARERGLAIERQGFDREMERQRDRARLSWKGAEKGAVAPAYQKLLEQGRTKFVGYAEARHFARGRAAGGPRAGGQDPAGAHAELVLDGRRSTPRPAARWGTAARCILIG